MIVFSKDWHDPGSTNGGHFAEGEPDFTDTWPAHCVANSKGAQLHPSLTGYEVVGAVGMNNMHVVLKGQGKPAYSAFEGVSGSNEIEMTLGELLEYGGIEAIDVCGIATDYCVRATVMDALKLDIPTTVFVDLVAGVSAAGAIAALNGMARAGAVVVPSAVDA